MKPTIKILLYTDDPDTTEDNRSFSLGTMIAHLQAHEPTFANLCHKLICRNSADGTHAGNKLEAELIEDYDQIWFFGFHQSNRKHHTLGVLRGGDESELVEAEVSALKAWMGADDKGGGVLMAGDHSQKRPPDSVPGGNGLCPDKSAQEKLLGLGRAIGRCVPRAGRLRKWERDPTNDAKHSFNTQVEVHNFDVESSALERDAFPQHLVLRHFNEQGEPAPNGLPHPLFFYRRSEFIRVFPDHRHEGAINLPDKSEFKDKDVWPAGNAVQPRPQAVAFGIDERNCRMLPVVAAYNGDPARVGRIVADSSWHHYLNLNLRNLGPPAPDGSDADHIGQYYANLAVWLSPLSIRRQMAHAMVEWVSTHRAMLEEVGNDSLSIGRASSELLEQVASPCEINELIHALVPDEYSEQYEALYLPKRGFALSPFPSQELILGSIVDRYQREMIRLESSDRQENERLDAADRHVELFDLAEVAATGLKNAFREQAAQLTRAAAAARKLVGPNQ